MNKNSALRPLAALVAGWLLLGTVVLAVAAQEDDQVTVAGAVGAVPGCASPLPDNPATGTNFGPTFQRAV